MTAAVTQWRSSLAAGGKKKLATAIADPSENAELFEEGWEAALARERGETVEKHPIVNGISSQ